MLGECCVACLASAILRHLLDRRVLSHVTACLASAVLRNGVLGECCLELPHAQRVLYWVTVSLASAVLHYVVLGECSLVSWHAWRVQCYGVLGE